MPRALPKMDLSAGLPAASRTLVVVPTLITSAQAVEQMVEALEVRFLGNRDDHIAFGLLTDLADAPEETLPEDEPLVRLAAQRIGELNDKYGPSFFLFHRPRRWNPGERVWMGYERKRGKLADLNALLRGRANGRFSRIVGDTSILPQVKYVITLDADTQLPRDAARHLVGAMTHPLNRARFDAQKQRVTEGYGILQPRVAASLTGAHRSRYARLWTSEPGIDPYTRVVSDVYQDLFSEGSFIGKGIYDVDAFELAVGGRFPENRILSHDLIEGCYARAGLLTDVQVYEEHPSRYEEDVRRRYRWIRGDWQLWRWLLPGVPDRDGRRSRNLLPALGRWKLLDNLRRSLVPAALVGLFLLAWVRLSPAWGWTLAGLGCLLLPAFVASLPGFLRKPDDVVLARHLESTARSIGLHVAQAMLTLACLPYEAFFSLDAALRTMARTLVTRRRLLEWTPSSARAHFATRRPACRVGEDVARARAGGRRVRVPVAGAAGRSPGCRARPGPLVCRPDHHVVHQPSARTAKRAAHDGPGALPPRRRPQDVGLLRHLRRARRPLAATGQFPGVARPRAGASHVADQHGAGAARQSLGLRLRLHLGGPARRPHHARLPGDVVDGTSPRPLLQLVRHPVARAARAPLHLFGGQRQPGRASADAEARSARASRRPDPAATHVRRASPHLRPRRRGQPRRAGGRRDTASEGARRGVRVPASDGRRRPAGPRTPRRGEPCAGRGARVGG